ncbi:MAG TPA: SpoIID/LytB domain-containing protein, partial [Pilimelia sp.]|nr:SpoIID/LytB domain-containing protein [Pilimelia sp.]
GWGHGRGMSQWGAQGAASLGRTADEITAFYYPGTARTVLPSAPIRVLLQGDDGKDLQVHPAAGLKVTDVATGKVQELPAGPSRWRVTVDSAGLHLQSLTGSTWTPYALGGGTTHGGPLRFSGPAFVRVDFPNGTSRDYRGSVQAVKTSVSGLSSVVVLPLEDYLLGVVPRESVSSWKPAALQAQAIAARSYSANKRDRVAGAGHWDICDTTQCQVFGGSRLYTSSGVTELEPATTSEAVRATAGVVRTYGGKAIFAEYSSSNGGWSTAGDFPYLKAQRDDWDGVVPNSVHSWKASLRATDLEKRFPTLGTLKRIRVTARDGNGAWGGRVKTVVLEGVSSTGAATSVTTTGAGVYNARPWPGNADGLKSSWWRVVPTETGSVVTAQSAAPTLVRPPGASQGTLTASLKNTGATAWPTDGLHLAVASPPGEADPLVGGSTRPGVLVRNADRPGATTVEPGETADFSIALEAGGVVAGTHGRAYRVRIGSGPLLGATVSWRIPVQDAVLGAAHSALPVAAPGATPVSSGGPSPVFPDGRTVVVPRNGSTAVRLQLKNTGNVTWPGGTSSPVLLGTSLPRNRVSTAAGDDWLSTSRAARLPAAVAPGASGAVDVTLSGNGHPVGITAEAFEPLWSGVGWIEGAARTLNVVRVDTAVSRLALLHAAPPASVALANDDSGRAELVVRLRNLGASPWQVGAERLGTAGDAAYPLATSAWASPSRPPALSSNANRPGTAAVHPGEIGEWRIPLSATGKAAGSYRLVLQAVHGTARYGPQIATEVKVSGTTAPSGTVDRRRPLFKGSGPRYVGVG